ncbi:hypothetical protein AAG570_004196 [Ranatra chinensis]|uniref:CHHC U11-48K-type domain-containing protein n=1 Tax=Ranatra chinensis TaxID=642074 RepID=A0ABD0YHL3_9HEMI
MSEAEKIISCPFNRAHSVLKGRNQFHLTRCRKQHPCADMGYCPYNSTHIFPKSETEYHLEHCESRIVMDTFFYQMGDSECSAKGACSLNVDLPPCEENWDDDMIEGSVLDVVKENAKKKNVLIGIAGASKAERKAHRLQERLRFQRLNGGDIAQVIIYSWF